MIGEQQRRVDVESRVRQELERMGLYRLPINPVKVANWLGMKVKSVETKDSSFAGLVTVKNGSGSIYVSEGEPAYLIRFTIAHEIGHYLLHLNEGGTIKDGMMLDRPIDMFWDREPAEVSEDWMKEIEANWFATELLMPAEFIREEWSKIRSVSRLAETFYVTEEAIGHRVADLALWIPGEGR